MPKRPYDRYLTARRLARCLRLNNGSPHQAHWLNAAERDGYESRLDAVSGSRSNAAAPAATERRLHLILYCRSRNRTPQKQEGPPWIGKAKTWPVRDRACPGLYTRQTCAPYNGNRNRFLLGKDSGDAGVQIRKRLQDNNPRG